MAKKKNKVASENLSKKLQQPEKVRYPRLLISKTVTLAELCKDNRYFSDRGYQKEVMLLIKELISKSKKCVLSEEKPPAEFEEISLEEWREKLAVLYQHEGDCLRHMCLARASRESYWESIRLQPRQYHSYLWLAYLHWFEDKHAYAYYNLKKSIENKNLIPIEDKKYYQDEVRHIKACILMDKGKLNDAISYLQKLTKDCLQAKYFLILAYFKVKNYSAVLQAIKSWNFDKENEPNLRYFNAFIRETSEILTGIGKEKYQCLGKPIDTDKLNEVFDMLIPFKYQRQFIDYFNAANWKHQQLFNPAAVLPAMFAAANTLADIDAEEKQVKGIEKRKKAF